MYFYYISNTRNESRGLPPNQRYGLSVVWPQSSAIFPPNMRRYHGTLMIDTSLQPGVQGLSNAKIQSASIAKPRLKSDTRHSPGIGGFDATLPRIAAND